MRLHQLIVLEGIQVIRLIKGDWQLCHQALVPLASRLQPLIDMDSTNVALVSEDKEGLRLFQANDNLLDLLLEGNRQLQMLLLIFDAPDDQIADSTGLLIHGLVVIVYLLGSDVGVTVFEND